MFVSQHPSEQISGHQSSPPDVATDHNFHPGPETDRGPEMIYTSGDILQLPAPRN